MADASRDDNTIPIRDYILREFLTGEDPDELSDTTPLMTAGILDSVATLKLVTFLEKQFSITLEAHEADVEYLNTVADIATLVRSKQTEPRSGS